MDDKELDDLFKGAAKRYEPPPTPEGAWDHFVETKRLLKKTNRTWFKQFNKFILLIFTPRGSWKFAVSILVLAIGIWCGMRLMTDESQIIQTKKSIARNDSAPFSAPGITNAHLKKPVGDSVMVAAASTTGGAKSPADLAVDRTFDPYTQTGDGQVAASQRPQLTESNLAIAGWDQQAGLNVGKNATSINSSQDTTTWMPTEGVQMPKNGAAKLERPAPNGGVAGGIKTGVSPAKNYNKGKAGDSFEGSRTASNRSFEDWDRRNIPGQWQIGLVGGSNLSVVGGTVSKSLGFNTGLMVQKRINRSRLSVETGVVIASMDYKVDNNDFRPGGENVSNKVSNIQGTCTMVDIPVNVRYDVVHSEKNNAFVSTGVSAMWMAKQNYNYQYNGINGIRQVSKDVSGQGKDLYATTNVSLGIEHRFKKTAVEVSPYVKIPLGNVGYGNLNLGSVGAQILIKQSF